MDSIHFNNETNVATVDTSVWEEEMTNQDDFMEEVETYTIFKIENLINIYWYPVLVPIGLIGNSLSFAVMVKSSNRTMSTCIYMAAISINDNLMMYVCCHDYLVSSIHILNWNAVECKFVAFCVLFSLQNSTYLILAMTVDKYIAIKWPHRATTYSTPRRSRMIVVCVYGSVFIYNIPHILLSSKVGDRCLAYGISSLLAKVYSWISFVSKCNNSFHVAHSHELCHCYNCEK